MSSKILIYGKSTWPFTNAAREAYAQKNIEAEYFDVKASEKNLDAMLKYSDGSRKVPVIVEGDKITIGFNGKSWRV